MKTPPKPPQRSSCPINMALEILGDRWSLLIIRDLMFMGRRQFGDFLASEEGIATNILSNRLASLARDGIVESRPDPSDRRRMHYVLTEKGFSLAPTVGELVVWSARHHETAAPPPMVDAIKRHRADWLEGMRGIWLKSREGE